MLLTASLTSTLGFILLMGTVLFAAAGTLHVPAFWLYLATFTGLCVAAVILVYRQSPDLVQERMHPGEGEQDKDSIGAAVLLLFLHVAVAGADVGRWRLSDSVPVLMQAAGLVGFAAGFAVVLRAMLVNRFFSSAVRLQTDRGQQVISSGPYRFVRHPGYAGGLLFLLSSGLALGSWLSIVPMLVCIPVFVRRTLIEDHMLQSGLPGYREYTRQVRYRLLPGIW